MLSIKTIGALLSLLGFLSFALLALRDCRGGIRAREELADALSLLRSELQLHPAPFPEMLRTLSRSCSGAGKLFMNDVQAGTVSLGEVLFSSIWKQAAGDVRLPLKERERRELSRPGDFLGRCGLEEQLRALDQCIRFFVREKEEMQHVYPTRQKLTLALSAAAGAILVILIF